MALHRLHPGVAPRRLLDHPGLLDEGRPLGRVLGDMDSAATDDRAAASAGAEFSESHSNRHDSAPYSQVPMRRRKSWWKIGFGIGLHAQMQRNALSASALTMKSPRNAREMPASATSVPFEDKAARAVNE
jgi:hypothetical protein